MSRRRALALAAALAVTVGAVAILLLAADSAPDPAERSDLFRDVAAASGLTSIQPGVGSCGYNAAGAAWGDADGDRDQDLFLPRQDGASELWLQTDAGRFRERGAAAGVDGAGIATAAAFGDHDNDGDADLFVGAVGGGTLFDNNGRGKFSVAFETAAALGAIGEADSTATTSVSWADFDRDGRLDLFATHGDSCKDDPAPAPNRLYRNAGGGNFIAADGLLEGTPNEGVTLDAIWFDADANGRQELYVGNDDLNQRPNALLRPARPTFEDITADSGAGLSLFTMAVDAGDLDANGLPDLAITDIGREALLLQTEPGRFSEQAAARGYGRELAGSGEESITWGLALADFDNDGDLDSFAAGGALGLDSDPHDDALYINDGAGNFEQRRIDAPGSGRVVAPADYDRDGDIDLLVAQLGGPPLLLENQGSPTRNWLELELIGRRSPRQPCGATVKLRTLGVVQSRELDCRIGESILHFGLGDAESARAVRIRWPSGRRQQLAALSAGRLHTVHEPGGR